MISRATAFGRGYEVKYRFKPNARKPTPRLTERRWRTGGKEKPPTNKAVAAFQRDRDRNPFYITPREKGFYEEMIGKGLEDFYRRGDIAVFERNLDQVAKAMKLNARAHISLEKTSKEVLSPGTRMPGLSKDYLDYKRKMVAAGKFRSDKQLIATGQLIDSIDAYWRKVGTRSRASRSSEGGEE